jgi:hypothetical protein
VLGARVLGEFGDDPDRYATAKPSAPSATASSASSTADYATTPPYNEHTAWAHHQNTNNEIAA